VEFGLGYNNGEIGFRSGSGTAALAGLCARFVFVFRYQILELRDIYNYAVVLTVSRYLRLAVCI